MNILVGTIASIETDGTLSLVDICIFEDQLMTALVVETPARCPYLRAGHQVTVLFKETEVSIAKNLGGQLSMRNMMASVITAVRTSGLLAEISLSFAGQTVLSLITARSAHQLDLQVGDHVTWLVKANEISLRGERHDP
ncbi:MAG: TOBE domain-containing protein [Myxococcales bacterium]|nr:TOBE domain-containing protein [Myxococcales bacterium]